MKDIVSPDSSDTLGAARVARRHARWLHDQCQEQTVAQRALSPAFPSRHGSPFNLMACCTVVTLRVHDCASIVGIPVRRQAAHIVLLMGPMYRMKLLVTGVAPDIALAYCAIGSGPGNVRKDRTRVEERVDDRHP